MPWLKHIIWWLALCLIVVGGVLTFAYLFSDPKLPQYYLVDPKYWLRTLSVAVGIILMIANGSRE